jgi:LysM repeat protein
MSETFRFCHLASRSAATRSNALRGTLAAAIVLIAGSVLVPAPALEAQSLRGSAASLDRQNEQARLHGFSYLRTPAEVRNFVEQGHLVPVTTNADFDLHQVSFPYARPAVGIFIERLASQYRSACGEKLVVTSLTRPISAQPANASSRSVHPTGMALDLRRPANARCRSWLESTLLAIESEGVIEAIYERNPPHYHVTVYPNPYVQYVQARTGDTRVAEALSANDPVSTVNWVSHRVARGETLTGIANRYGTTVARLRSENGIRGSQIMAGQSLQVPVYSVAPTPTRVASAAPEVLPRAASVADEGAQLSAGESNGNPISENDSETTLVHRVGRGESLWTISRLYGVSEAELRAANGIRGSRILVGQELVVPGMSVATAAAVIQHRVRQGDSLWTIAQQHGASVEDIRRQNGIGSNRIYAGQVLDVPIGR